MSGVTPQLEKRPGRPKLRSFVAAVARLEPSSFVSAVARLEPSSFVAADARLELSRFVAAVASSPFSPSWAQQTRAYSTSSPNRNRIIRNQDKICFRFPR